MERKTYRPHKGVLNHFCRYSTVKEVEPNSPFGGKGSDFLLKRTGSQEKKTTTLQQEAQPFLSQPEGEGSPWQWQVVLLPRILHNKKWQ